MALGTNVPSITQTKNIESLKTVQGVPIYIMGHNQAQGMATNHNLGTITASGGGVLVVTVVDDALYEFTVVDDGSSASGTAENLLMKPGASTVTITTKTIGGTEAYLMPTATSPTFQVHTLPGQVAIAFATLTAGAKTLHLFGRRLV